MRTALLMTLAALASLAALPAEALDRRLRLVNASRHAVIVLNGTPVGQPQSDEDMLGSDDLVPGETVILSFEDGSGYCRYALKAVFDDGVTLAQTSVNVCEVGTWRLTD